VRALRHSGRRARGHPRRPSRTRLLDQAGGGTRPARDQYAAPLADRAQCSGEPCGIGVRPHNETAERHGRRRCAKPRPAWAPTQVQSQALTHQGAPAVKSMLMIAPRSLASPQVRPAANSRPRLPRPAACPQPSPSQLPPSLPGRTHRQVMRASGQVGPLGSHLRSMGSPAAPRAEMAAPSISSAPNSATATSPKTMYVDRYLIPQKTPLYL